jgi:hypothetical protein
VRLSSPNQLLIRLGGGTAIVLAGLNYRRHIEHSVLDRFAEAISFAITVSSAFADSPYCTPKSDGTDRIAKTGSSCPSGYFASGNCCEAFHKDTPRAFPKLKGEPCPSGTFAGGHACKAFR